MPTMKKKKKSDGNFRKRGISCLIVSLLFLAHVSYAQDGSKYAPFLISNFEQIQSIATGFQASSSNIQLSKSLSASYKLISNIDATAYSKRNLYQPIGTLEKPFTGSFDGDGFAILNFSQSNVSTPVALFGTIGGKGHIKNVKLEGVNIHVKGASNVAALALVNKGLIESSSATGSIFIAGNLAVAGGLVAINAGPKKIFLKGGIIRKSYAKVDIVSEGIAVLGGLVGKNFYSISESYASGSLSASAKGSNSTLGGLVGISRGLGAISYSYANGFITTGGASSLTGGLIGKNGGIWSSKTLVINSYYDIEATGQTSSAGGAGKLIDELPATFDETSTSDTVYLIDESVIHGKIIEDTYNKTLQIEGIYGEVATINYEACLKIVKNGTITFPSNGNPLNEKLYTKKSPAVALLLSLILPGAGQYYNGDYFSGIIFTLAYVTSIVLAYTAKSLNIFYAAIISVAIFNIGSWVQALSFALIRNKYIDRKLQQYRNIESKETKNSFGHMLEVRGTKTVFGIDINPGWKSVSLGISLHF